MKIYYSKILLLMLICCSFPAASQTFIYHIDFEVVLKRTLDENDSLYHEKLAKRFAQNDPNLSDYAVLALLINFTSNKNYAPYEIVFSEYNVSNLIREKKFKEAINTCDSLLNFHPYNQELLFDKALIYYNIGDLDSSHFYQYKFNRIMDAMASSGSGAEGDAIFSLGSKDWQNYIVQRLSNQVNSVGSGIDETGNYNDIIQSTDSKNDTLVLHFQIQHAVNKLLDSSKPIR